MPAVCPKIVRGRVMRITKLDACGVPVTGSASIVTSTGFIAINATMNYEDASPIKVEGANGVLCINDPGCPQFSDIDLEMQFCGVDPDLLGLITGDPVVLNDATPTPSSVGFRIRGSDLCTTKFGLEVWSDISGQTCTTTTQQYWYHLFPFVGNPVWGDFSIANDAVNFTVTGTTLAGSGWGVGPQNVINVLPGPVPGKLLTPITAEDHYHGQVTTLAPPTAACGATALV